MASPGEDIPVQLATLLGKPTVRIRRTDEVPPRVSIIDVVAAITSHSQSNSALTFARLKEEYPDVVVNCSEARFPDARGRRGQKDTPVADAKGIAEIIMLLPGQQAARVRRQAAELFVRYLGGDLTLVEEVCALRGFQEHLAAERPEDPRRVFGAAIEAAAPQDMARVCAEAVNNAIPRIIEQLARHLDQRMQIPSRQINFNVRAPKRAANQPPSSRDISGAGRPLPLAKYLDEREDADLSWGGVRKSFAPSFGMMMQVLKKRKLHEQGGEALYVEQNRRAQLLYTETDRTLMGEAISAMCMQSMHIAP